MIKDTKRERKCYTGVWRVNYRPDVALNGRSRQKKVCDAKGQLTQSEERWQLTCLFARYELYASESRFRKKAEGEGDILYPIFMRYVIQLRAACLYATVL